MQDEQGGVLPGVIVTLQGVDATRETVTGMDGGFRFLDLAPGPYKLTAALAGFSAIVQDGIVVAVGKTVDLRLTTKIAGLRQFRRDSGRHRRPGYQAADRRPGRQSGGHQGDGLFRWVLVSLSEACDALSGRYGIFRARGSDLEQERREQDEDYVREPRACRRRDGAAQSG